MHRVLLATVLAAAALAVAPTVSAAPAASDRYTPLHLTAHEAFWAARRAGEQGPFRAERIDGRTIRLVADETHTRDWVAPCPFPTDCGPCQWHEVERSRLAVRIRERPGGRYRVRDNLGWSYTARR